MCKELAGTIFFLVCTPPRRSQPSCVENGDKTPIWPKIAHIASIDTLQLNQA
jgi:hypothetical protein